MSAVQQRVVQFGLTEVWSTPEQPLVDVVFVHGLNGHPYVSVHRLIPRIHVLWVLVARAVD